jgi:uncharacterized protein
MSVHPIVHVEFTANDPAAAGNFYKELFGWHMETIEPLGYVTFNPGMGPGGGFPPAGEMFYEAGNVIVYVSTDDIDQTLSKIEALGGQTLIPKLEVPGQGWMALFADPTGNRVGLWTTLEE